ncbi:hypothetical protein [Lysobacter sp. CA199]|uniref:hypothetical protein n=1 Tax=Lysobacter sp. CA199 TaxID=3455608 RepID=UPI003F8D33A5
MNDWIVSALPHLLTMIPGLLLYTLGLSLCLVRSRTLGRASTYASLGFGLLLLSSLLGAGSQVWFTWMAQQGAAAISSLAMRMAVLGIVNMLISLVGITLLLAAILARRPAPAA